MCTIVEKQDMQTMMSNQSKTLLEIKTMMSNQKTEIKTMMNNQNTEIKTTLSNQKTDVKNIKNQMRKIISMLEKAECSVRAAGIENSAIIADHQLTSSSHHPSSVHEPRRSRLHSTTGLGWVMSRPWRDTYRVGEWLQVDLESNRKILGVATQGARGNSCCYVTSYQLEVKKEEQQSFDTIRDDEGNVKIFNGNVAGDADSVVKNNLGQPITARIIRIIPLTWQVEPDLRWEIYLC